MNKNLITEEGYQLMRKKLSDLEKNSKEIADKLTYARLDGDLSENADWIVLRENLESTQDKIIKIRQSLENCDIIKKNFNNEDGIVKIGSRVSYSIVDEESSIFGKEEIFEVEVTSEIEADPFVGKISYKSPLGSSLLEKKVGDVVEVLNPSFLNNYKIKVLKVK